MPGTSWRSCALIGAMIIGCGGSTSSSGGKDASTSDSKAGPGDAGRDSASKADAGDAAGGSSATGTPCVPNQEYSPMFSGFNAAELSVEAKNPTCGSGVCLVNHFQGSVDCPYGQSSGGVAPPGAKPCTIPGASTPVAGQVSPWCSNRTAAETVYCSCRCANADGKTNDGASYCACSTGFSCTQLVSSIGAESDTLSGAYCIKVGTMYSPTTQACTDCDPTKNPCP